MTSPIRRTASGSARPPRWDAGRRAEPAPTPQPSPVDLTLDKVNLAAKLSLFSEHWSPKVVGELNGQQVRLAKLLGPFVWHQHEVEDELFLVLHGHLRMEFRDRTVDVNPGEFIIVPHGVEHRPVADQEVHVLLFEPATTLNTGDVREARTVERLERL
ncbi:mannose-6-phosphate isomerase [Corallococcus sp. H22C18031201]|nr:mannose-6-phosphate isomerase [Corallococcus sp. H22C18031201]